MGERASQNKNLPFCRLTVNKEVNVGLYLGFPKSLYLPVHGQIHKLIFCMSSVWNEFTVT